MHLNIKDKGKIRGKEENVEIFDETYCIIGEIMCNI